MIFEKIDKLFKHYLYKEVSKDEILESQKQFEVLFANFRDELDAEIGAMNYEILDSIFMIFDSYEPDAEIRVSDKHCIDEVDLIREIRGAYEKIEKNSSKWHLR